MSFFEERARLLEMSTKTDQLPYTKAPHFATGEGERYEEATLALLFLRCFREGLQFILSSNDDAGGRFDDAVLCWSSNASPVSTLFVQLKHKTSAKQTTICKSHLTRNNNDFSIMKYHESYRKMRDSLDGGNYALVLSTNLDLDIDAKHMFVSRNTASVPGMNLLQSGGSVYSLNPDDEDVKLAVQGDDRFVRHFYLFCNQCSTKTIKFQIYRELELLLGADENCCAAFCETLCNSVREWKNTENFYLTRNWKIWLDLVDTYIKREVTSCNSIVTRIKYSCVEPVEAHIRGCNPAWIRPPVAGAAALSATKVHQAVCAERHILAGVAQLAALEAKVLRCWGALCPWLVLVDDAERSYDTLFRMVQQAGPNRRLVIVSYQGDDSFQDTCQSGDISDDSWKELIGVTIKLNSEDHQCCLEDLCETEALMAMLDGNPEALLTLSQLSGSLRMGQDLDPLPAKHTPRKLTSRMHVRKEFFSSLGYKDVCITDEVSYNLFANKYVLKNTVRFEELGNYLSASDVVWPLLAITNKIDVYRIQTISSKHEDIVVYVLCYTDDGWEILFVHRGTVGIRKYFDEQSRSVLKIVQGLSNRVIIEGKPGVGKSTMLLDMASQLKGQCPSWWILRIDLLKYSEVFDSCDSGVEASKEILLRTVYNEKNVAVLEHSILCHCLLEYPRIICMVDGFDEVCPDYKEKCLWTLQELTPRRGKLVVTTRSSEVGHLETTMGVLAHSLPAFSEDQLRRFLGWSGSEIEATRAVRDLLRIPLFSRMYAETLESGITVNDIVSLFEAFLERKFRRLYEEKWGDDVSKPGKKKKIERERMEHEKQLEFLAVSHLLPSLEVTCHVQPPSVDRDDLLKAGVISHFINDKPVFTHRTFAEYFLAKWCLSDAAGVLHADVYHKALSERNLEFFVESFDRMASRGRPLLAAVLNGSESEVKSLLEKGADPAEEDNLGRNSLHLAAAYSHDSTVVWLLIERLETVWAPRAVKTGGSSSGPAEVAREAVRVEAVPEVDEAARPVEKANTKECRQVPGDSELTEALGLAQSRRVEMTTEVDDLSQHVQALQAATAALGAEDGLLRWTPLRYAAERRRLRALTALLEAGAQLRHLEGYQRGLHSSEELWGIFNKYGYDQLWTYIVGKQDADLIREYFTQTLENQRSWITEVGLNIVCTPMTTEQYEAILHSVTNHDNVKVAKLLKQKVLEMKKNSTRIWSPALELHSGSTTISQVVECKQMPLQEASSPQPLTIPGDCVMYRDEDGETMLHKAARKGDAQWVRQLIQAGADINAQNNTGESAIHLAAVFGNVDCINMLHSAGAELNMGDRHRQTPLHRAAAVGSAQSVKLLLAAGADVLVQDSEYCAPLDFAAMWENFGSVKLLAHAVKYVDFKFTNSATALHYAALNGDDESVKHLLRGATHNSSGSNTLHTPLQKAGHRDDVEFVRQLVRARAHVARKDAGGTTRLSVAAGNGSADWESLILKASADTHLKSGATPLHCAVKGSSPACIRLLVEAGADVDEKDTNGDTPLHLAIESHAIACVRQLLECGANVSAQSSYGRSPLHCAVTMGNPESVRLLLEAGAHIEQVDGRGNTPLHVACGFGHSECVRRLLEYGADIEQVNARGGTPLHVACEYGDSECVRHLLEYGAHIEQVNARGETPLHVACQFGKSDCVIRLLQCGARVRTPNVDGNTPLHNAAGMSHADIVMLLVYAGADIEQVNEHGNTPLHWASLSNYTDSLEQLLEAGARVTARTNRGNTPLHCAAMKGKVQSVKLLLDARADTEQSNRDGRTPLYYAATSGDGGCIRLLSEYGAHAYTRSRLDHTLLSYRSEKLCHGEEVDVQNLEDLTPLHYAVLSGSADNIKRLLEEGATASVQDKSGNTPLHYAARRGSAEAVALLMEAAADLQTQNTDGCTPLFSAVLSGNEACVRLLLKRQPKLQAKDKYGNTLLHCAAEVGSIEIVRLLIREGADVEARNRELETPLHTAVTNGNSHCVEVLLEEKAQLQVRTLRGSTPLHDAIKRQNGTITRLLSNAGANVHEQDKNCFTPLHYVVLYGKMNCQYMLELLNRATTDLEVAGPAGLSPLHLAAITGSECCVQQLLKRGACPTTRDDGGSAAVHHAASNGNAECLETLLRAKAGVHLKDGYGHTALKLAMNRGHYACVRHLADACKALLQRTGNASLQQAESDCRFKCQKLTSIYRFRALRPDTARYLPNEIV